MRKKKEEKYNLKSQNKEKSENDEVRKLKVLINIIV